MSEPRHDDADWLDRKAYPFKPRWAELERGRMHYVDEGHGAPIVFAHGTPTWSFEFRHLILALSTRWRCVAPDHLGFGLSERPHDFEYTPEAHARTFAEFTRTLGLRDFALVVHDYGGPVALPLALDGLATRLVLLNTWMWPFDDDAEMRKRGRMVSGAFGRFAYRHLNASLRLLMPSAYGNRRKLTRAIHAQYLAPFADRDARERVLWPLARAINGSREYYAALWSRAERLRGVPALIVWGMRDTAFRPGQLTKWESLLPHARVVRLASAGHWPHEEEPSAVIGAMREFLLAVPGSLA